jgi:hypothetical protein
MIDRGFLFKNYSRWTVWSGCVALRDWRTAIAYVKWGWLNWRLGDRK